MKYLLLLSMTAVLCCAGCARQSPPSDVVVPPPDIVTLAPIAVINLSAHFLEPSGIFYNRKHNSLFVVSDERGEIFELSLAGEFIKSTMTSGDDLEGISMNAACDTFYVVEETRQLVTSYRQDGSVIRSFPCNVATVPKNSLEGIAVDGKGNLFVLNEKSPRTVIEYCNGVEVSRIEITNASDISDICYDAQADCFWIVSDESKKVFTIDRAGRVLAEWLIPFDKCEGITLTSDKMYLVNDANANMYIFQKP